MAKNIRWQIPFVSIQGVHYRVDIYDEGTFTPVQLTAGPTPFVTDEDASDDFFCPVRSQSGTLQVCTLKPDGTYITLDELLPANNIARPVRLINRDNSDTIEWQGFLSCEAYSQDYTGIPQNLDLPVISVLEAMASVEVELNENMAFKKILGHVAYAMKAIENGCGMSLFNQVYIASYVKTAITTQYFYNNVYFQSDEIISGDNITVEVHSISCKKILEQVAEFLGCCWREVGSKIYLEVVGSQDQYEYALFSDIYTHFVDDTGFIQWDSEPVESADLEDSDWMGTGHQRTVMQGMRRVKVSAKLKDFSCNMSLRECPVNDLVENPSARQNAWGEVYYNSNENFYNLAEHKYIQGTATLVFSSEEHWHYDPEVSEPWSETVGIGSGEIVFNQYLQYSPYLHTQFWEAIELLQRWDSATIPVPQSPVVCNYNMMSFMAFARRGDNLYSGLMIIGCPKNGYESAYDSWGQMYTSWEWTNSLPLVSENYVFKQRTAEIFYASSGFLCLDINSLITYANFGQATGDSKKDYICISIKCGTKWAYKNGDQYEWSDSFQTIDINLSKRNNSDEFFKIVGNWDESMGVDERDGLFIPITSLMVGIITISIYPHASYDNSPNFPRFGTFITKLNLEYVKPKMELTTNRSENAYATETSQAFRDELSVDCEIASYANNNKLATMVWNDETTPAKLITLGSATVRPEVDLLNRLASYYGAARQRLELEVAHPTDAPLPLLKLQGISPDNRVYLPLSESRDWQTNVCKLTCFETPNNE